ncbi:TIGR02569 family protein [Saccharopolyspora rhizosphaerae]|uniref:TIGR02569 family protein n=1 Tax=Saccharopolyspora rhizosphaerae TaxID=2492662 RepID=A0A3R8P367_9PSEU|nr:TIGR02569 family protein [Saccharopolyspora rhizosphaerae]RRO15603.1 TIGR02569 family protein [Saccharopolyspora rhizosphaerae]
MSATPEPPPPHVCAAFGARVEEPEALEGAVAWRCGEIVLKPAANTAEAAWVAQTLDALEPDDVRVSRPVRSTDGRWVVSGWSASRDVTGRPEPRHDEVVAMSLRLHAASRYLSRPRFLQLRQDIYALADRMAWGEEEYALPQEKGGRLYDVLAGSRRPMQTQPQVVHGDLFGNVLFAGDASPGVIDFNAYWRPAEWAAAVVVIDSLAWGGADPAIVERWSHLTDWPQALLRALLFRLAVHSLHPRSSTKTLTGLERASQMVLEVL